MRNYQYENLTQLMMPMKTVNLIAKINEYKGKQELYKRQAPQILDTLRDVAVIHSTKASNAIEGIIITDSRLMSIMKNDTDLQDRSEGEIAGYRDVLQLIHASFEAIPVRESVILQLHKEMYRYISIDGGTWKNADNVITETFSDGAKRIRFEPVSAFNTPRAMERVCFEFRERMSKQDVEPLILLSIFILDFLSIHPFSEGNGRMARLLTLLLLYQFGFEVGRYISLEKIIEESKEEYYETLRKSSIGWHEGTNDIFPWINYLLGTFVAAYKDLESRVGVIKSQKGGKSQRVHVFIEKKLGFFTKSDIRNACPDVSEATINRVLSELKKQQLIESVGLGRNAKWKKK
ncbi:Fic family protein [Paenisporosarcina antarctica]|uniref:Fic family protein n=1 Tax=Paenisporosarcina antarctica TaxID=417367 RepID=A0A4P7A4S3_9BACL|nr:Fic family protein [Paenisporosarcina antarctica]QBP43156.1 Fic family protein [Paenisporosarcina antarctica]